MRNPILLAMTISAASLAGVAASAKQSKDDKPGFGPPQIERKAPREEVPVLKVRKCWFVDDAKTPSKPGIYVLPPPRVECEKK